MWAQAARRSVGDILKGGKEEGYFQPYQILRAFFRAESIGYRGKTKRLFKVEEENDGVMVMMVQIELD
ncbi:MAG: hypothetical protein Phog2KO_47790 [Phototrophicaceae bacterium]